MSGMGATLAAALRDAMVRGAREFGRTSDEATKHALIAMARSARPLTKMGAKKRPVIDNPGFVHLMRKGQYKAARMAGKNMRRYYKYAAFYFRQDGPPRLRYANDKESMRDIKRVGVARRSWGLGLKKLGAGGGDSSDVPNVVNTFTVRTAGNVARGSLVVGREMDNALSYIMRVMAPGWENTVVQKAINWMRHNLEARQARSMGMEMQRARAA